MSLANDQISHHKQYDTANALLNHKVKESGFENVARTTVLNFASGNSGEQRVWYGETAPGTNYDSVASIGDVYYMVTFSDTTTISAVIKYVYTSNGWEKAEYLGVEQYTETTLTSAQVKALNATPIELVAAPGTDLAIVPTAISIVVNYGGTNAFTETDDDLSICYETTPTEIMEIESTGLIDQTNDEWRYITFEHDETFIPLENQAVVITNLDDEIAGNAGADNTVKVKIFYRIVDTDA